MKPREFYIDPHEHHGPRLKRETQRHTAWSALPVTGIEYIHVIEHSAVEKLVKALEGDVIEFDSSRAKEALREFRGEPSAK